jgi:uncharacterized membrane protein
MTNTNDPPAKRASSPAHMSVTFDVQASAERVFSVLQDVERWPEWTSTMTAVKKMDDGPLVVGSKVRVRQPQLLPAVWLVTGLEKNRVFTWGTRSPGIQITGDHRIESVGSSSRVTLSLEICGPLGSLVSRLFRGLNKRYIATEAKGLKERCEAG